MKKINWRVLNIAFWITLALAYFLPFKAVEEFQYMAGFPIPFITVYNTEIGISPLTSMNLNPLALLANGIVVYLIISLCVKAYKNRR